MSSSLPSPASVVSSPLRVWPGVALAVLLLLLRFVLPAIWQDPMAVAVAFFGGALCGVGVLIWWVFFSRASRGLRWGGLALAVLALVLTPLILHPSIATGMMGMMFHLYALPTLSLALVAATVLSRNLAPRAQWATLAVAILVGGAGWALVRSDGITGAAATDFAWRWSSTPEEQLLAGGADASTLAAATGRANVEGTPWPGFRGPQRDGRIPGVGIATDWSTTPPMELWRRPIGPGWSSFAVAGDVIYTHEQRGDEEVVSCYRLATGEPVWSHADPVRFWEANAGAGPRATPTLHDGRLYSFGATGILNALDARDGSLLWSRDAAADTGHEPPGWGFSSSPLVVPAAGDRAAAHDAIREAHTEIFDEVTGDTTGEDSRQGYNTTDTTGNARSTVIVHAGSLAAYDAATGAPQWSGAADSGSYSSPHALTLDGIPQILQMTVAGATSVAADGTVLWEHPWSGGMRIVQPAVTASGDLLLSAGETTGLRRLSVKQANAAKTANTAGPTTAATGTWTVEERWTTHRLKPYFSDFVVHGDHAYGFDGTILACLDLTTGERCWKGGRYGSGQLVLLQDQNLLLVLSEEGEIALVQASPDGFTEVARAPGIDSKTWNHPVLVGDVLLLRNGEEMAAFRLPKK